MTKEISTQDSRVIGLQEACLSLEGYSNAYGHFKLIVKLIVYLAVE